MPITLNTSGRCPHCGAIVTNIEGRRRTKQQLAATHEKTCPGLHRGEKPTTEEVTE
jgi:hypothetical protein